MECCHTDGKNIPAFPMTYVARPFLPIVAGSVVLCLAIFLCPAPTKSDFEGRPQYSKQEMRRAIIFYAAHYRLDPALLRAVIKVESDFRPHVVSRKGAVGLMQLTPETAATLRVADVHDPLQNIRGGAKQLRRLLNRYRGNLSLTLAAYNAGIHRVKRHRVPPIRETRAYVRKVLMYYRQYQSHQSSVRSSGPHHGMAGGPYFARYRRWNGDREPGTMAFSYRQDRVNS